MPRLTYVTRLWTVDHMRCSPPVRPAALKHGIGTRGGLRSHAAPFRPRERSPRRPPYSTARCRLSSLEADSTACAGPIRPRAGRFDRTRSADRAGRGLPTRPTACRPDRPGSADPAAAGRCHRRQLPTRPGKGPLHTAGCGPGRRPVGQALAAPRSAANETENNAFTTRHSRGFGSAKRQAQPTLEWRRFRTRVAER